MSLILILILSIVFLLLPLFLCLFCYPGIACITLSFVDAHGGPLVVPEQDCTALHKQNPFENPLHPDQFEELTAVFKIDSSNNFSGMVSLLNVINGCKIPMHHLM